MSNPTDGDAPLPTLQDAVVDAGTIDQLFFDVGAAAELVGVVVRTASARDAAPRAVSLAEARRLLDEPEVTGVQLRYRYGGSEWWDTLVRAAGGVRIVRIEHRF